MSEDPKLIRIVFWNVDKKDLTDLVCELAKSTSADAIVLCENRVSVETALSSLQKNVSKDFVVPSAVSSDKFHCFCRKSSLDLSEAHSGFRCSVRHFNVGQHQALLALVHVPDLRNHDEYARLSFAHSLAREMQFAKKQQNTKKLVMLGDFNLNPYDVAMNLAGGLNAMMTKACVSGGYRTFQNERYEFFYNPMWGLFGDNTAGPPGTIHDTSNQGMYGWSMFDQVLFHYTMVETFHTVEILTQAGETRLTNKKGRPDKKISDHFPLLVSLRGG